MFSAESVDPGVLIYPVLYREAVLYGFVSELGTATQIQVTDDETATEVEVALEPGRAALALLDRRSGRILGRYGG